MEVRVKFLVDFFGDPPMQKYILSYQSLFVRNTFFMGMAKSSCPGDLGVKTPYKLGRTPLTDLFLYDFVVERYLVP